MEEIMKSYKSGITILILSIIFIASNLSLFFIENSIAVTIINIVSYIILVLALGFYFKMMVGYANIGNKYNKLLTRSTYMILALIIIWILLGTIMYFANIEEYRLLITIVAVLILIVYILFAIFKIFYGLSVYKIPVNSNTKSILSIFSMLYGISMLIVVGIVFLPYIKAMEMVFQTLFLKDTYTKKHKNKNKRNNWWWISTLIIYVIIIGLLGYFFYFSFPFA